MDVVVAASVAVAQGAVVMTNGGLGAGARLMGLVGAVGFVGLAWRNRRPVAVLVTTFAAVFAQELIARHSQSPVLFLAILIATYSLGVRAGGAALATGVALCAPAVAVGHALGPPLQRFSDLSADAFFFGVLVVAPVSVGRIIRARNELARRLAGAGECLTALREQRVSNAVAHERERIVSELERATINGMDAMAAHAEVVSLHQVTALECAARETLAATRELVTGLRSRSPERSPSGSLTSLHERVALALATGPVSDAPGGEAEAALLPCRHATPRDRWAVLSMRRIDVSLSVVAAALGGGTLVSAFSDRSPHGSPVIDGVLAAATVAPIAWARRAAWPATAVAVAALLAHGAIAMPPNPEAGITPTGLLLCFPLVLGAQRSIRSAGAGLGLCLGAAVLLPVADPRASPDAYAELATTAAIILGAWSAGRVLAARSRLLSSLADTAIEIDREQRTLAHDQMAEERIRLARELHDAFAHSMTVIVLQAGAARRVWDTNQELARDHVATLRTTLGEVLGELRELILAIARDPGHAPAGLRLEGLVQRARASGMDVELAQSGEQSSAAAEADRILHRIVQETLTNAARHAPGAAVHVRVDHALDTLSVVVENGPAVGRPEAGSGSGRGLQGMRERAAAHGGTITTESLPDGGFRVAASLPLTSS